jgi:hypothetical protein
LANPLSLSYAPSLQNSYRTAKDNEKNTGDHGFVFRHTTKSTIQKRMDKSDFVKIDLCSVKNTVKITKRESTHWQKNL